MSMSLRLSEEAVHGSSYQPSKDALEALQRGDTTALIASHRDRFGGWKLELEDDPDDEDEDDDVDDDDDDEDSDDEDDEDEDSPEGKKSKKAAKKPEGDPQRKIAALEDEKNRLYRGRQKAREERDDWKQKYEDLRKSGGGDETLKTQVQELETTKGKVESENQSLRLQIAFLSDNTYEWQNPGLALRAADLSDVEIDDDGKVHGMVAALEKLATDNPFLLKQKEEPKKRPETRPGSTGKPPARKSSSKEKAKRAEIAEKYRIRR